MIKLTSTVYLDSYAPANLREVGRDIGQFVDKDHEHIIEPKFWKKAVNVAVKRGLIKKPPFNLDLCLCPICAQIQLTKYGKALLKLLQ